jgi:NAD(P)-dependent dehydrogenase (short-subunit alcohol dehydrogenase family)
MNIEGKTALVTGGNRGLGRALTEALLAAGAGKVYAGARNPDGVDIAGASIVRLDVTDPRSVEAAARTLSDVAILINNAGVFQVGPAASDGALESGRSVMETNFFGVWAMSRAFAPVLKANSGGEIVNILSALSWVTIEGTAGYSASKSAAWALTNGLRRELKAQGTAVLAVHVGYMDTDMAATVQAAKISPRLVAERIVAAIQENDSELLVDDTSAAVKAGLTGETAYYL